MDGEMNSHWGSTQNKEVGVHSLEESSNNASNSLVARMSVGAHRPTKIPNISSGLSPTK